MIAAMQAKNVEIVRVMIEGTFRAIRIPVTTGTISNQGVMLNLFSRLIATSVICSNSMGIMGESHDGKQNECDYQVKGWS